MNITNRREFLRCALEWADMQLRPAQPDDAMAIALVHVRSWQAAYRTLIPDNYLDLLRAEDRAPHYDFSHADPAKTFTTVAIESGSIRGFATTMPARDRDMEGFGELCALYVDPDFWGQGMGKALSAAARARLAGQGFHRAILWVLAGNERAQRFYLSDSWTTDNAGRIASIWGIELHEVRYQRSLDQR